MNSILYVFGLGTGRCGTFSLARLLDIQKGAYVTHEHGPCLPWLLNEARVKRKINDIKSRIDKGHIIVGDVALFNLKSAEMLLDTFPAIRFVILKRDKIQTIKSWQVKWRNKYNRFRYKKSKWELCFPYYNLPLYSALTRYYDEYYNETLRLMETYPYNFKYFDINCLNNFEGVKSIFDFCGISKQNRIYKIGIKDNMNKDIVKNQVVSFDKYDKNGAYHLDWFRTNKFGYRTHLNRILREFNGCKAAIILDIGCGEGLLAKLLLKKGVTQKVLGIDINEKAIELGKDLYENSCKTKKMELKCQAFSSLDRRRRFDYIVCSEVIEHVDNPELFLRKIDFKMKKWAIITTPNADYVSSSKYDKQVFNSSQLIDMFERNGIKYEFLEQGKTIVFKIIK